MLGSVRRVLNNLEKNVTRVWEIVVFECNLKYMDASNIYHKTLKEHHVIIHFANKTEKRNAFYLPEGWLDNEFSQLKLWICKEYVPLVGIEAKYNTLFICFLEHVKCSLKASERTVHRLPFLPLLCYTSINDVAGIKFYTVWISAFRIWSHQL